MLALNGLIFRTSFEGSESSTRVVKTGSLEIGTAVSRKTSRVLFIPAMNKL